MAATCVALPMGPACVNITGIRGGDRNLITGTVTSKGEPVDLTGMTLAAQARKQATDATAALTAVIEITDPLEGAFTMRWPGAAVTTLLNGKKNWTGVWDLQVTEPDFDPLTIAAGTFAAEMDVTR